jgi:protein phosphatase
MLQLSQTAISDQLQIGHYSHPGRSGKNNEDYYGIFSVSTAGGECVVAAVADGIGGSVGGEQASRLAIRTLAAFLEDDRYAGSSPGQRLDQAIQLANREIYAKAQNDPSLASMGTTIVAVALDGDRLHVVHAGDSRAYLVRDGRAQPLTLDHSWAQEAIEAGRISVEAAKSHPNRHVIRRYLGINEDVETDMRVVDPNQPAANRERPATVLSPVLTRAGDTIVLCSDGLTDEVSDEEIARIASRGTPEEAARRLVDAANAAGGADNITAVILQRGNGRAAAAGRRSPLVAYGLAAVALLIVGALGWLIASGALFGGPGRSVAAAPTGSPAASEAASTAAAVALAVTPPADAAAQPTATSAPAETPPTEVDTPAPTALATTAPANTAPSTETSTPVPTVTPQPSATATIEQTATSTPVGSPTVADEPPPAEGSPAEEASAPGASPSPATVPAAEVPTSTPASRANPSPTVTPTAAPTSTRRPITPPLSPTPMASVQASPNVPFAQSPTPTSSAGDGPTELRNVLPLSGKQASLDEEVTFSWTADAPLQPGQVYELVFWSSGETANDGKSPFSASASPSFTFRADKNPVADKFLNGVYNWGVWLRDRNNDSRIRPLGQYQITFSGGGSSDSGDDSGDESGDESGDNSNSGGK